MPAYMRAMKGIQGQIQAKGEVAKQARLDEVAKREVAAKTDAEKAAIRDERAVIVATPKPEIAGMDMMDLSKMGMTEPPVLAYFWVDYLSMFLLNTLLIVSGVGLLRGKPWSRKFAIQVAAAKIVRLGLVCAAWVLVVVPTISPKLGAMVGAMMQQQQQAMGRPGAPNVNVGEMTRVYGIMYTAYGVGLFAVGIIYPAILIWLLSRPTARAAFANPAEAGPDDRGGLQP